MDRRSECLGSPAQVQMIFCDLVRNGICLAEAKMVCTVCGDDGHDSEGCAYTPYIRNLQRLLMSYCLPVWFVNELGRRAHGSMTLVDTGDAVLGITARH